MNIDSHIHIDGLPSSIARLESVWTIDNDAVINFIKENDLNVVELLYRNYSSIEYISQQLPNVRIIGLRWIDLPVDQKSLKHTIELINEDIYKPLCKGIKIHDHRIWDKEYVTKEQYKESYRYDNRYMKKVFEVLPDNSIVLMHIQGNNKSTPDVMLSSIINFPNIKFIIGHAGAYGGLTTCIPSSYKPASYIVAYHQLIISMRNAIYLANHFHNVYLDNTMPDPYHPKCDIHKYTDKVIMGSDFGITAGLSKKRIDNWKSNLCNKCIPGYDIEAMNQRFVDWVDTDWKVLNQRYVDNYKEEILKYNL